ncbi:MAG: hypothetical protein LLF76_03510 [Planctomycetaceae bacterium]|nr:hypothetical protein [Planctomycetaceae bacterium]
MDTLETPEPRGISILEPIGAAVERTSEVLFRPFNAGKWFVIGFAAWLASIGSGRGGGGGNYNFGEHGGGGGQFHQQLNEVKNEALTYLPIILSVGIVVVVFAVALAILFLWLRSRGQFVFLNCVARNSTRIADPWNRCSRQGNSLFLFKLVLGLIQTGGILLFIIPLGLVVWAFAETDFKVFAAGQVVLGSFMVIALIGLALLFAAIHALTIDFVVPIMYVQGLTATEAWRRLLGLMSGHKGLFVLYLLFIFLISIMLGIGTAVIGVTACCCLCCVAWMFCIPFVGGYLFTVLSLPLWVWRRGYSAFFLAQFGPEYDVFRHPDSLARDSI